MFPSISFPSRSLVILTAALVAASPSPVFFAGQAAEGAEDKRSDDISLSDRYRATLAMSHLERLLTLDDVWTAYLEKAGTISEEDKKQLSVLTKDMMQSLKDAAKEVEWLQKVSPPFAKHFDEEFAKALGKSPADEKAKRSLEAKLKKRGGVAAVFQTKLKEVTPEILEDETKAIAAKMERIAAGRFTKGDLSHRAKCGLWGAGAVAAGIGGHWSLVVAIAFHMDGIGCFD